MAECRERRGDIGFRHGNDAALRAAQRPQHLGGAHRLYCGDAIGDGGPRDERHVILGTRPPGRSKGGAIRSLDREKAWPAADLAAGLQIVEPALEAEAVAAIARRHVEGVGDAETALLPPLTV